MKWKMKWGTYHNSDSNFINLRDFITSRGIYESNNKISILIRIVRMKSNQWNRNFCNKKDTFYKHYWSHLRKCRLDNPKRKYQYKGSSLAYILCRLSGLCNLNSLIKSKVHRFNWSLSIPLFWHGWSTQLEPSKLYPAAHEKQLDSEPEQVRHWGTHILHIPYWLK